MELKGSEEFQLVRKNRLFLHDYNDHVVPIWRKHYFCYDRMKALTKFLKQDTNPIQATGKTQSRKNSLTILTNNDFETCSSLEELDDKFLAAIRRVDRFLSYMLNYISKDIAIIGSSWQQQSEKKKIEIRHGIDRTFERALREVYRKSVMLEKFLALNLFAINKIGKKIEKYSSVEHSPSNFSIWKKLKSYRFLHEIMTKRDAAIKKTKLEAVKCYQVIFRNTFDGLALGELDFEKNKGFSGINSKILFGCKVGASVCLIFMLIFYVIVQDNARTWGHPGLYLYSSLGCLLVFQATWIFTNWVWVRYDVNYLALFNLDDTQPRHFDLINSLMTIILLYFISLLLFFQTNQTGSGIYNVDFAASCPIILAIFIWAYEYMQDEIYKNSRITRGLFSKQVWFNCLTAPFSPVTFRDNYAGDVLTSFTKFFSNIIYAGCWIVSGAFIAEDEDDDDNVKKGFGTNFLQCSGYNLSVVISVCMAYPLWIRFCQCAHNLYVTKAVFPHFYNALKYLCSMCVVMLNLFVSDITVIATVVVLVTLYTYTWDIVMDWGLCEILPWTKKPPTMSSSPKSVAANNNSEPPRLSARSISVAVVNAVSTVTDSFHDAMFLRKKRMYPMTFYYIGIVLNLVLRFLWVISLVPFTKSVFPVGPALNFFLGMMEIFRRAMWGIFRMEWEHLKHVDKGDTGFKIYRASVDGLQEHRLSYNFDPTRASTKSMVGVSVDHNHTAPRNLQDIIEGVHLDYHYDDDSYSDVEMGLMNDSMITRPTDLDSYQDDLSIRSSNPMLNAMSLQSLGISSPVTKQL